MKSRSPSRSAVNSVRIWSYNAGFASACESILVNECIGKLVHFTESTPNMTRFIIITAIAGLLAAALTGPLPAQDASAPAPAATEAIISVTDEAGKVHKVAAADISRLARRRVVGTDYEMTKAEFEGVSLV